MVSSSEFVWIASYPHGIRRKGQGHQRTRCVIAAEPWLEQVLQDNSLDIEIRQTNRVSLQVVGLARLAQEEAHSCWAILSNWGAEARVLWTYLGRPRDAFVLPIETALGKSDVGI